MALAAVSFLQVLAIHCRPRPHRHRPMKAKAKHTCACAWEEWSEAAGWSGHSDLHTQACPESPTALLRLHQRTRGPEGALPSRTQSQDAPGGSFASGLVVLAVPVGRKVPIGPATSAAVMNDVSGRKLSLITLLPSNVFKQAHRTAGQKGKAGKGRARRHFPPP